MLLKKTRQTFSSIHLNVKNIWTDIIWNMEMRYKVGFVYVSVIHCLSAHFLFYRQNKTKVLCR